MKPLSVLCCNESIENTEYQLVVLCKLYFRKSIFRGVLGRKDFWYLTQNFLIKSLKHLNLQLQKAGKSLTEWRKQYFLHAPLLSSNNCFLQKTDASLKYRLRHICQSKFPRHQKSPKGQWLPKPQCKNYRGKRLQFEKEFYLFRGKIHEFRRLYEIIQHKPDSEMAGNS